MTIRNWHYILIKSGPDYIGKYFLHFSSAFFFHSILSKNLNIKINKTTILLVILHVCKTWSVIVTGDYILRECDNKVLRRERGALLTCYLLQTLLG